MSAPDPGTRPLGPVRTVLVALLVAVFALIGTAPGLAFQQDEASEETSQQDQRASEADAGGQGDAPSRQGQENAPEGGEAQEESGQQAEEQIDVQPGLPQDPEALGEVILDAAGVEGEGADQQQDGAAPAGDGQAADGILPDLSNMSVEEAIARLVPWLIAIAWDVLAVIGILIAAFLIGGWLRSITKKGLSKAKVEPTIAQFSGNALRWLILVLALVMALAQFGINITSLAALLGAGALAIGLAFQGALSNIAAGVMLAIFRPFRVGEWVELEGELGTVTDIDLFYTHIDQFDDVHVILPNSTVLGAKVQSLTHNPMRRVEVPVGVAYGSDLRATRRALERAARDPEDASTEKEPLVILTGFGDSSINWDVRVWGPSEKFLALRDAIVQAIDDRLAEAGVTIPFPQRDINTNQPLRVHLERFESDGQAGRGDERDASQPDGRDGARASVREADEEDAQGD